MYYNHTNIEAQAKYNCSLEHLIGGYHIARIRKPLLARVRNSKFLEIIEAVIRKKTDFTVLTLDMRYPIEHDIDPVNK